MTNNAHKKAARAYMAAHPGVAYTAALRATNTTVDPTLASAWGRYYHHDPLTVALGEDPADGALLLLRFEDISPHLLITGDLGTGKTLLAEFIAAQVRRTPMPWDPDLYGQALFHSPDHSPMGDLPELLEGAVDEMWRRFEVLSAHDEAAKWAKWLEMPEAVRAAEGWAPLLVVIDAFERHLDLGAADPQAVQKIMDQVELLARKGRVVGVHVVLVVHEPQLRSLPPALLMHLPARVVLGPVPAESLSRVFLGEPGPEMAPEFGAGEWPGGLGRVMVAAGQRVSAVQVPAPGAGGRWLAE